MQYFVNLLKWIIFLGCFLTPFSVFSASVISVSSGDTLTILDGAQTIKIRLAYIDAPEVRQPYANYSRRSLTELCSGKDIKYQTLYTDRQKQAIAIVYCLL